MRLKKSEHPRNEDREKLVIWLFSIIGFGYLATFDPTTRNNNNHNNIGVGFGHPLFWS